MTNREVFRHLLGLAAVLVVLAVWLIAVWQLVAPKPVAKAPSATVERTEAVAAVASPGEPAAKGKAAAGAPASAAKAVDGKTVYNTVCQACHAAAIAGAPKFGDKAVWAPRIAQGKKLLYDHAIKGYQGKTGVMPPKGGYGGPDADVRAAVDYMVEAASK